MSTSGNKVRQENSAKIQTSYLRLGTRGMLVPQNWGLDIPSFFGAHRFCLDESSFEILGANQNPWNLSRRSVSAAKKDTIFVMSYHGAALRYVPSLGFIRLSRPPHGEEPKEILNLCDEIKDILMEIECKILAGVYSLPFSFL